MAEDIKKPDVEVVEEKTPALEKIDLGSLQISTQRNPIQRDKDIFNSLYKGRSSFKIVMPQSAYKVNVKALNHHDISSIINDESDPYEYRRKLYYLIYEKLERNEITNNISFEKWLSVTSVEDVDTLFYGLYAATFKDNGVFTMDCPKCGETHTYSISHTSLIHADNSKDMDARIRKINEKVETIKDMEALTLVGLDKGSAIKLPESEMIASIRVPSLLDSLELMRLTGIEDIEDNAESIVLMLYIHTLFIPDGNGAYYDIIDRKEIIKYVKEMSIVDAGSLIKTIEKLILDKKISYAIKQLKCPTTGCGAVYNNIPVSIEDILFTQIIEKTQLF